MRLQKTIMLGLLLTTADVDSYISSAALKYNVEPALIRAHIKAESNWNPSASRYEAHLNDSSLGLMQILLKTAREQSGNKNLTSTQLLDPKTNIDLGTKYIAYQLNRYGGNVKDAIAAYNAGSAKKTSSGQYINQAYVNKVHQYYRLYGAMDTAKYALPFSLLFIVGVVYFLKSKSEE